MRLDKYLVEQFGFSRNRAQMMISEELISVNSVVQTKSGYGVTEEDSVEIQENDLQSYVSRSALKLKYFLEDMKVSEVSEICIDIGASTGGFTQVLLEK